MGNSVRMIDTLERIYCLCSLSQLFYSFVALCINSLAELLYRDIDFSSISFLTCKDILTLLLPTFEHSDKTLV